MNDKASRLKFNKMLSKYNYDTDYVPKKPSAEALICLTCTADKCKGICDRYKEEHKKLREQKNGK